MIARSVIQKTAMVMFIAASYLSGGRAAA